MSFEQDRELVNSTIESVQQQTDELVSAQEFDIVSTLGALAEVSRRLDATVKALAIGGVQHNAFTRKEVAETIGKHPITISRWITAHEADQNQQ